MKRILFALALVLVPAACVIRETPPPSSQPPAGTATATAAPTPTPTPTPTATATAAPTPTTTAGTPPPGMPTFPGGMPTMPPPGGTTPGGGGTTPGGMPGGLTIPGVCIPVGTWTKKFDNGLPASGSVQIAAPVLFNQFPVTDGVVVAGMPAGSLKGTGAMTSTNDLSVDVTNAGYVLSYTCKFGGNCKEGTCTVTKGGLGGFKLIKQ